MSSRRMRLELPDGLTLYIARHGQTEANVQRRFQASPQLLLNIIEVNMFEKTTIDQLVFDAVFHFSDDYVDNQMILL